MIKNKTTQIKQGQQKIISTKKQYQQNTSNFQCLAFLINSFQSLFQTLNLTSRNCKFLTLQMIQMIPYFDSLFDMRQRCDTLSSLDKYLADDEVSRLLVISRYVRFDRLGRYDAARSVSEFLLHERSHNVVTCEMCLSAQSLRLLLRMSRTFKCFKFLMCYRLYEVNWLLARFNFYKLTRLEQIITTDGLFNRFQLRMSALSWMNLYKGRISLSVSWQLGRSSQWVCQVTVISLIDKIVGWCFIVDNVFCVFYLLLCQDYVLARLLFVIDFSWLLLDNYSCCLSYQMVFYNLLLLARSYLEFRSKVVSDCCFQSITEVRSQFYFLNSFIFFFFMQIITFCSQHLSCRSFS